MSTLTLMQYDLEANNTVGVTVRGKENGKDTDVKPHHAVVY